jgi:hypothetical protein
MALRADGNPEIDVPCLMLNEDNWNNTLIDHFPENNPGFRPDPAGPA